MKFVTLLLIAPLYLAFVELVPTQTNPNFVNKQHNADRVEKEITRLEELGRQKALKGEKNWDDLIAESAYLIQGDGTILIYRKGQDLSSIPLKSFQLTELIVRVYGDSAIATGLSEITSETTEKKLYSFQMRYLNVWKKFGDKWKITVAERTMVRPYAK